MNESNNSGLIIAFVVVVVLFLVFGGGAMSGSLMGGGGMMGAGTTDRGSMDGYSWMWIPTLITLGVGVLLGWMVFGKRN